jgi:DNA mismatch repair protein MutH
MGATSWKITPTASTAKTRATSKDAMTKHKFYQLKPVQVAVLRRMASYDLDVFTLLEPNEHSTAELKEDWVLAQDMIKLGLVLDIKESLSVREKAKVNKMVPKDSRHIVLGITEVGRLMFDYCDDPACTEHKKRLPC